MAGDEWRVPGASDGPDDRPGGPVQPPTQPASAGPAGAPPWPGQQGPQGPHGHQGWAGQQPPPPLPPGQRPVIPLRPLGLGDVLAGAFIVFRRNARVLVLWAVLLSGVLGLVSTLVTTFGQRTLQSRMLSAVDGGSDADSIIAGSATLYLVLAVAVPFLAYLGRGFLVAPVAVDTGQRVLGRRGTFRGLWSLLAGRRWSVVWWILLQLGAGVVVGGLFVLVGFGLLGAVTANDGNGVVGFVLGIIGMVLVFVVLLAFLTTRFAFTVPTIALEGRGVFSAAAQSWRLTRGAFWRTFGILLLVQVVFGFAASIAGLPLSLGATLVSGVFDPLGQTDSGSGASVGAVVALVVGSLLVIAVQCVTDVLSASVTTFLAIDRRIRTEALDQRIASHLETGQPGDPFAPADPVARPPWTAQQQWPQQQPGQQPWPQQQQQPWPPQHPGQPPAGQQPPRPPQWGPPRPGGHG
ncbi:glycerophosphoryl diester phosphodiesterase membrane domain-containing protein [Curtobacterium sp. MCLR17_007]|uniref:glycerophosphoryl diester phosphodiesterase membrane domain-containing protein n=1 Tax=Curtobacterium sp. MCLR17_007 TaxID=2175648 RepID=UPI000DA9CBBC|nr:glycerophosphoryl diester phosphodiesterase membrane domain-containing protein [Curtobacterium sp. MCLR17_007]WIB59054.1 glycerophosphoryl diester phosphodiesterase membrane domain-containing protein [Curtobacterium sp. MCLR17_007]